MQSKQSLKDLIAKDRLDEVVRFLLERVKQTKDEHFEKKIIFASNKLSEYNSQKHAGMLESKEINDLKSDIVSYLTAIIYELPGSFFLPRINWGLLYEIFRGLTFVLLVGLLIYISKDKLLPKIEKLDFENGSDATWVSQFACSFLKISNDKSKSGDNSLQIGIKIGNIPYLDSVGFVYRDLFRDIWGLRSNSYNLESKSISLKYMVADSISPCFKIQLYLEDANQKQLYGEEATMRYIDNNWADLVLRTNSDSKQFMASRVHRIGVKVALKAGWDSSINCKFIGNVFIDDIEWR